MAQGILFKQSRKASGRDKRKADRVKKSLAGQKMKEARPKKSKKPGRRGDIRETKLLHRNIERLAAAKAMRNEGQLKLGELNQIGKKQLKVEDQEKSKKKTKAEQMEIHLEAAKRKLQC